MSLLQCEEGEQGGAGSPQRGTRLKLYYDHGGIAIYHGDCRELAPIPGHRSIEADCLIADPPFNAGKDYGPGTDDSREDYPAWLAETLGAALSHIRKGGAAWVMNDTTHLGLTLGIVEMCNLTLENIAAWAFGNPTPSSSRMPKTWRPIVFARVPGTRKVWNDKADLLRRDTVYCNLSRMDGRRILADLWPDIPKLVGGFLSQAEVMLENGRFAHLAQMPIALAERPILLTTNPGDLVLDPFMGSGTSLVAAKKLGRHAIGVEIEERYCELAAKRLAQEVLI